MAQKMLIKIVLPPELNHLKGNADVRRILENAYDNQVVRNHGWGFTVALEGLRVRFDSDKSGRLSNGDYVVYYKGSVTDSLNEVQLRRLQRTLRAYEETWNKQIVDGRQNFDHKKRA